MKNHGEYRSNRRNISRPYVVAIFLVSLLVMGSAQAQWKVVDNQLISTTNENWKTDKKLQEEQKKKLEEMYRQQYIGTASSSGKLAEEPPEHLDPDKPSPTVDLGVSQRCPPATTPGVPQQQRQLCEDIVKTERAQYTYSLRMYEQTKTRHERLQAIEQERLGIGEDEQGKLQDNSNKLLALLSLMEIDRQQQKTYMDAYEARLRYLGAARNTLTEQALEGKSGASPLGGVIGAGVMAGALEALKTRRRYSR